MQFGAFKTQLNDVEQFLKASKLQNHRLYPRYDRVKVSDIRQLSYDKQFQYYKNNGIYDFELRDGSLLQFIWNKIFFKTEEYINMHFNYLEYPLRYTTFEEYQQQFEGDSELPDDLIRMGYESDRLQKLQEHVQPIRYDFQPQLYEAGKHSESHFHIGFDNDIRLTTVRVIQPLTFALFICRNFYPNEWFNNVNHPNCQSWYNSIRDGLDGVDQLDLVNSDKNQLVLH